jgi:hypothetical protein
MKARFDADFVMRVTMKRMKECVESSLHKTFNRIHEFEDCPEKAHEVFKALSKLHILRKHLETIQKSME